VKIANCADATETVLECCKRRRLWEEHEKAIETLVQVRVALRLEKLEAKICKNRRLDQLDQFVNLDEDINCHLEISKDLHEVVGLLIRLSQEAE